MKLSFSFFVCLLLLATVISPVAAHNSGAPSPYDLLSAVNGLRASNGMPAYQADGALMSSAQAHSEYQASLGTWTHQGAGGTYEWDRAAAAGYGGSGAVHCDEAVAIANTSKGVDYIVYTLWADYDHRVLVLLNPNYVDAGAGVVEKDGMIYYTLDACYQGSGAANNPAPAVSSPNQQATPTQPQDIEAVTTATTQPDGSIIHEVQPGQSLWAIAIAYGIKIADIVGWNKLSPNNPVVYIGQKLVVHGTSTVTLTPTLTFTSRPVTRTPTPSKTPRPTEPSRTPTMSPTPTQKPLIPTMSPMDPAIQSTLGYALVGVCALGLLLAVYGGFFKKS
jgi:LysM repeat protein